MRKLLNTLFVTTEDAYLALDGETVIVLRGEERLGQFPLHALEGILCFSYKGASPHLMGACAERGINLCFMTPHGRFLARSCGEIRGSVNLRKRQYRLSDSEAESCLAARNFVFGKVYNSRWSIDRTLRDHALRVDAEKLEQAEKLLDGVLPAVAEAGDLGRLRGLEGTAASAYFGVFDDLILNQKERFFFRERSRRPPLDNVNALLSFAYSLLASECASAAESAGLDSCVGFLHRDRPGRASLALDMMEELRALFADRFVLTLINNRVVQDGHFEERESGAVALTEAGRKAFLTAWQNRKREEITHPFLKEKLPWGLVPHVQALLLASFLRGDLDGYPPFLWK